MTVYCVLELSETLMKEMQKLLVVVLGRVILTDSSSKLILVDIKCAIGQSWILSKIKTRYSTQTLNYNLFK